MNDGIRYCFRRYEKKYLLDLGQYSYMLKAMAPHMVADEHSRYTICNIYYDTEDYRLIRASLEKPVYKEKLRVRSYGAVRPGETVFVELKKKYKGVVYKRRVSLPCEEASQWLAGEAEKRGGQIFSEIDWFAKSLSLEPKVFIGYDREAYSGVENSELRITFDTGLRWRDAQLDLRAGDGGMAIMPRGSVLMEIKIPGSAPLWLARALSENGIFPVSFSKYGTYYTDIVLGGRPAAMFNKEVRISA